MPGSKFSGGEARLPHDSSKRAVQFGSFELQLETGELRKNGIRLKLQGKSFYILQALLERPGEVVTREELKVRLWPGDTFVDFESGLNTAANRLRLALGDSAENPRYIETVARSGYRFIGNAIEITPQPAEIEPAAPIPEAQPVLLTPQPSDPPSPPPSRLYSAWLLAAAGLAIGVAGCLAVWLTTRHQPVQPSFRRITYRRGTVSNARFGPDGPNILYTADWDGEMRHLYQANTVSPESRDLGFTRATLAGVSTSAELALLYQDSAFSAAKLSRVPLNGGSPLTVATGVSGAEWGPDGKTLAVFRNGGRESVVEYPLGKVLYRTPGAISDLRISPTGEALAFVEHPLRDDDGGVVKLIEHGTAARDVAGSWASLAGLAWAPSGKEVWFTAGRSGVRHSLYAATLTGKIRQIASLPGMLMLFDISKEGRVLLGIESGRLMVSASFAGEEKERDISWFDWTHAQAISPDGNLVLFDETGDGGGSNHSVYIRNAQSDSAVRLGDGQALALSPDQKWALSLNARSPGNLNLIPIGPYPPSTIAGQGLEYCWAHFFPDGQKLLVGGHYPGKPLRLFVQPVNGAKPVPLSPEIYLRSGIVSPDGKQIAGLDVNRYLALVSSSGGEPRAIRGAFPMNPIQWSPDGKSLFVRDLRSYIPARISRFDPASGQAQPWKELAPADRAGIDYIMNVVVASDGKSYAYSYMRVLSELYAVDGWT